MSKDRQIDQSNRIENTELELNIEFWEKKKEESLVDDGQSFQ